MKSTPLTEKHLALGAKMAEFAGYNMPISYTTITDEHQTVRTSVGVFDVSHMGEFIVKGKEATAFLQSATSNDVSRLNPGDIQYSCLPNKKGGIVDDLLVYRLDDVAEMTEAGVQTYMLVVNASNETKDWRWLKRLARGFDVKLQNISAKTGLIAVQGPKAAEALQKLTDIDLKSIGYYSFRRGRFAGCNNVIVSATGYTGSGGFEIYARNRDIAKIWDKVFKNGAKWGIKPVGLGARDTLRLEKGFCLYGNDIDDTTSPIEAGLGWITKFAEGKNFIDRERLEKQKAEGVSRKLIRFELTERGIPRHGYEIVNANDEIIGHVTSGTMLPESKTGIGMGYVNAPYFKSGEPIFIKIRNKNLEAKIVK